MTRLEHNDEEEDRRRRALLWLFFGTVLLGLFFTTGWLAMGIGKPDSPSAAKTPSASPSPTSSAGVVVDAPLAGALGPSGGTTAPQAADGNGNGNGGSSGGNNPGHPITVTGVVQGQLAPGRPATLLVTITNPNSQDILVISVTGSVTSVTSAGQAGKPACSTSWFQVGSFSGSRLIDRNSSRTVSLPVTFNNSQTMNQDNCKGARYSFSVTAKARQA